MTVGSNVVKITAKSALKDKWLKSVFACCIYLFAHFICVYSASILGFMLNETVYYAIFAVLGFFLLLPLMLGVVRYFWRLIMGADDSPINVFYYLSCREQYLRALRLFFALLVRIALISVVVLLPAIAVWIISNPEIYEMFDVAIPIWSSNLNTIWAFLGSISVFVIISLSVKYYLAPLLIVADESMEIEEAIVMSKIIAKKTHIDFIFLVFSFIGWILLSLLVIPLVFTLPYIITSYAVHCRFAIADYNMFINKQNQSSYGFYGNYGNEI